MDTTTNTARAKVISTGRRPERMPRARGAPLALILFSAASACGGESGSPDARGGAVAEDTAAALRDSSACTGSQVPGDYATVQDAVDALDPKGGSICLRGQSYDENVVVHNAASLTITGASRAKTSLTSLAVYPSVATAFFMATRLEVTGAVVLNGPAQVSDASLMGGTIVGNGSARSVDFDVVTLRSSQSAALAIQGGVVTIDRADVSGTSAFPAIAVAQPSVSLTVTNAWIHDSSAGVEMELEGGGELDLENDTFIGNATAIYDLTASLDVYNSLFVDNGLAVYVGLNVEQSAANAYFHNTTNFAGFAVDGSRDIKTNPLLSKSSPPGLDARSPCRGAALLTYAPQDDYHGAVRDPEHLDIGAVQSSP